MIAEPNNPEALLVFIRNWFRLLAADRWPDACASLDERSQYGIEWTPEYIRHALNLAFGPDCRFRSDHPEGPQFSDPDTASGTCHASVLPFDDGRGFSADHDVPLNGLWSDLTAQFEFLRRPGGLAVILHDLHVL